MYSYDAVRFFMELVVAEFMAHIDQNEQTAGNSNSQAGNVDRRIAFVLLKISKRDFEIVF